jgi:hypothetical protein
VLPNAISSTLAYPMFREGIGYLLHVDFCTFLRFFPHLGKGTSLREATKSTSSRFPTIFLIFREQNYFLLPYKKIPHNRFNYFSLYQLNIIFLLLFYSFSLFPTFSFFPISINYTSFILK